MAIGVQNPPTFPLHFLYLKSLRAPPENPPAGGPIGRGNGSGFFVLSLSPHHFFPALMNGAKGTEPPLLFGCLRDEARDSQWQFISPPPSFFSLAASRLAPVQWPRRFSRLGLLSYPALSRPPMRGQEYKVIYSLLTLGTLLGSFHLIRMREVANSG